MTLYMVDSLYLGHSLDKGGWVGKYDVRLDYSSVSYKLDTQIKIPNMPHISVKRNLVLFGNKDQRI